MERMKPPHPDCERCKEEVARMKKKSNDYYKENQAKLQAKRRKRYRDKVLRREFSNAELRDLVKGISVPDRFAGIRETDKTSLLFSAAKDRALDAALKRRGIIFRRSWRGNFGYA